MVMRRHAAWHKNERREVARTLGRFLSILMIVMIGVVVFIMVATREPKATVGEAEK